MVKPMKLNQWKVLCQVRFVSPPKKSLKVKYAWQQNSGENCWLQSLYITRLIVELGKKHLQMKVMKVGKNWIDVQVVFLHDF